MKSTRGARHTGEAATGVKAKAKEAASSTSHVQKAVPSISGGEESTASPLAQEADNRLYTWSGRGSHGGGTHIQVDRSYWRIKKSAHKIHIRSEKGRE